jgi:hypothetical protein
VHRLEIHIGGEPHELVHQPHDAHLTGDAPALQDFQDHRVAGGDVESLGEPVGEEEAVRW